MSDSLTKVNPDLAREREKASFNPVELTFLLYGGRERTERKRYLGEFAKFVCTILSVGIGLKARFPHISVNEWTLSHKMFR